LRHRRLEFGADRGKDHRPRRAAARHRAALRPAQGRPAHSGQSDGEPVSRAPLISAAAGIQYCSAVCFSKSRLWRRTGTARNRAMKLSDLPLTEARFDPRFAGLELMGIASDSRKVKPGDLFVAVPGTKADGLAFVPQALANGASAVLAERAAEVPANVAAIVVPNVRRALALCAAAFFPRQPGTIAAVTGTSGKTSVAAFARQIWASLGLSAASMGTVGVVSDTINVYGSLTTPDPIELHKMLDRL